MLMSAVYYARFLPIKALLSQAISVQRSPWLLWYIFFALFASAPAVGDDSLIYNLNYTVELQPDKDRALVTIAIDKSHLLPYLSFQLRSSYSDIKANGEFKEEDGRGVWHPPEKNALMTLAVNISHERNPGDYDARMTSEWAIFRGDDIIPAVYTDEVPGAESRAVLTFKLPADWSIETAWPRMKGKSFRIDNPERRFDRPIGWMIAGKLGTRRTQVANTNVAVAAPQGENVRRMDLLTFLTFIWPQMQKAFGQTPDKLLIVGAGDPMWRGGLSASNSLFLHADRPLVSENGTSPLIHELVHMVTRISSVQEGDIGDDWFVEGIAEFYSFELMFRAGAMTRQRRQQIIKRLAKWGEATVDLRQARSSGPVTARAVVLLDELDKEIRTKTKHRHTLDDVVRGLMPVRRVSLDDIKKVTENLLGGPAKTLQSPLLGWAVVAKIPKEKN